MVLFRLVLLSLAAYPTYALSIPTLPRLNRYGINSHAQNQQQQPLQDGFDAWVEREEQVALERLLANIAPGGSNVGGKGVAAGTVIASPSQQGPDYWYQWVRDAAITMDTLVDIYADDALSIRASHISTLLDAYTSLQHDIQHTSNPSGTFNDLSGLGEPKFHVDGSPFTGSWGRPQRDGPALRSLTLMHYLRAYNASHPFLWRSEKSNDFFGKFYAAEMPPRSVIKADLEYVSHYWNESSFDLWEEVQGLHFFNLMVSARSLREGSKLAAAFGDAGAAAWYEQQAGSIAILLRQFWSATKGHLVETLGSNNNNNNNKRSGLDCGLLLGSLHALPAAGATTPDIHDSSAIYPPWSDQILVSLLALAQDQHARFPLNRSPSLFHGTALGRYPEDTYDGYTTSPAGGGGGNPWFLCTSAAASILYHTASHLSTTSNLTITNTSLPFYTALFASFSSSSSTSSSPIQPGSFTPAHPLFHTTIRHLSTAADQFLAVVRAHVDADGAMSEQFDRATGYMRGARDLTWSYGAFLQAGRARRGARSRGG